MGLQGNGTIPAVYSARVQLAKPMLAGLKDYDSNIDELRSALKAAGWDTYVAEIQKQYDEFLANK